MGLLASQFQSFCAHSARGAAVRLRRRRDLRSVAVRSRSCVAAEPASLPGTARGAVKTALAVPPGTDGRRAAARIVTRIADGSTRHVRHQHRGAGRGPARQPERHGPKDGSWRHRASIVPLGPSLPPGIDAEQLLVTSSRGSAGRACAHRGRRDCPEREHNARRRAGQWSSAGRRAARGCGSPRTMTKADRRTRGRQRCRAAADRGPPADAGPPSDLGPAGRCRVRRAMQAATTAMAPRRMPARRAIPVRRSTRAARGARNRERTARRRPARRSLCQGQWQRVQRQQRQFGRSGKFGRKRAPPPPPPPPPAGDGTGNGPPAAFPPGDRVPTGNGNPCNGNNGNSGSQGIRRGPAAAATASAATAGRTETDRRAFRPATHVPRAMAILAMAITGMSGSQGNRAE